MRIKFEAQLLTGLTWDNEAGVFVSFTPALNLHSQGPTEDEALRAMESAIKLYLATAYEESMLDRTLKEKGFGLSDASANPVEEYIKVLEEHHFDSIHEVPAAVELSLH